MTDWHDVFYPPLHCFHVKRVLIPQCYGSVVNGRCLCDSQAPYPPESDEEKRRLEKEEGNPS